MGEGCSSGKRGHKPIGEVGSEAEAVGYRRKCQSEPGLGQKFIGLSFLQLFMECYGVLLVFILHSQVYQNIVRGGPKILDGFQNKQHCKVLFKIL